MVCYQKCSASIKLLSTIALPSCIDVNNCVKSHYNIDACVGCHVDFIPSNYKGHRKVAAVVACYKSKTKCQCLVSH